MPCSCSAAMCSGRSRRASRAPWMAGCSVLTRPSSSSGKPVTSSTVVTGTPAARSAAAVPPVEMISQPSWARPWAKATMPRLSLTEISARGMTDDSRRGLHGFGKRHGAARRGGGEHHGGQQPVLDLEHARRERSRRCRPAGRAPVPGRGSRPRSYTSSTRWTVAPLSRAPLASTASCTRWPYMPAPAERRAAGRGAR